MAGGREERLMMRQRGAGVRQVKDLGFDLVLPGQSKSPLKPRKSGRARKTPQPDFPPQGSMHGISEDPVKPREASSKRRQQHGRNAWAGNDGDKDVLGSDLPRAQAVVVNARKRKSDDELQADEPMRSKRRKPAHSNGKEGEEGAGKGKPRKPKGTAKASNQPPSSSGKAIITQDSGTEDPITILNETNNTKELTPQAEIDPKATSGRTFAETTLKAKKDTSKPQQRGENQAELKLQELAAKALATVVFPARKRKKRISIGQQSMKRTKRPQPRKGQKSSSPRSLHETSDLVNELLGSTTDSSPKNAEKSVGNAAIASKPTAQNDNDDQNPVTTVSEVDPAQKDEVVSISAAPEPSTAGSRQTANKKPKPRRKRRSITQVRRPRKTAVIKADAGDEKVLPDDKDSTETPAVAVVSPESVEPGRRGRKPLTNITNAMPDPKSARIEDKPTQDSSQDPIPLKKRGRPRKNPPIENSNTSISRAELEKPARKPKSTTTLPKKPKVVPKKAPEALPNPPEVPEEPKPATASQKVKQLTDPDEDSDDPLSGASTVRPFRKRLNPIDGSAQTLLKKVGNKASRAKANSDDRKIFRMNTTSKEKFSKNAKNKSGNGELQTPQKNNPDDESRREIERKEIDELLGSIGKAIKKGRAMGVLAS